MPARDIVVVGASAGGVEAMQVLASSLPPGLPAALFFVIHVYPGSESRLPQILAAAGPLPAIHPADGDALRHGTIYVAPPDFHLTIEHDHVHLRKGPKEQHQRPSINVTFRSAAFSYGKRVIGVVLTGQLDDGVSGLWNIKRRGGVAVVQNPEEAAFPSMPLSALREVEVDYSVGIGEIGPLLGRLCRESVNGSVPAVQDDDPEPTGLTCPDCRGTLNIHRLAPTVEFRCRVGHRFSPKALISEHLANQERLLWSAIAGFEETASMADLVISHLEPESREPFRAEVQRRLRKAGELRHILERT